MLSTSIKKSVVEVDIRSYSKPINVCQDFIQLAYSSFSSKCMNNRNDCMDVGSYSFGFHLVIVLGHGCQVITLSKCRNNCRVVDRREENLYTHSQILLLAHE